MVGPIFYGGGTVPGMRLDRERLAGSRKIMRRLDELLPERPLFPPITWSASTCGGRALGDEVFQSLPRRILDAGFLRDSGCMESYARDTKLPLPRALLRPAMPLTAKLMARRNHAQDERVRADLAALPGQLEQIDAWVAEGVLGGEEPNAADLQIGSSIRLLETIGDVRPLAAGHPAARSHSLVPAKGGPNPGGDPASSVAAGERRCGVGTPRADRRPPPHPSLTLPPNTDGGGPAQRTPSVGGSAASASARRLPSGVRSSKSSSSAGINTKRRLRSCSWGNIMRSSRNSMSPSSRMSISIARGPWRGPPAARPSSR